jgi:hypothetical protein
MKSQQKASWKTRPRPASYFLEKKNSTESIMACIPLKFRGINFRVNFIFFLLGFMMKYLDITQHILKENKIKQNKIEINSFKSLFSFNI